MATQALPESLPTPKHIGRPSSYCEEIAREICDRIVQGQSLRTIAEDPDMPSTSCMMTWMAKYPTFQEHYVRARDTRAHARFERLDQVIEDMRNGLIDAHVARVEIDTLKWMCARENVKKYGDRIELAGDKDNPLVISVADVLRQREKQLGASDAITIDVAPEPKQLL